MLHIAQLEIEDRMSTSSIVCLILAIISFIAIIAICILKHKLWRLEKMFIYIFNISVGVFIISLLGVMLMPMLLNMFSLKIN